MLPDSPEGPPLSPGNNQGDVTSPTPEEQRISEKRPQSFAELSIQPGSTVSTTNEWVEFLAVLTEEERSKAGKKLGRPLDQGGAFRVRITTKKDGSQRSGIFEFPNLEKFLNEKEKYQLEITNPEQPTTQKETAEAKEPKTDWSYVNELNRKQKEEERSKMTPEELAEDDKKQKQFEEGIKWAERSQRAKEGDPKAMAEEEEAKKKLEDYAAEGIRTIDERLRSGLAESKRRDEERQAKRQQEFRENQIKRQRKREAREREITRIKEETRMTEEQMNAFLNLKVKPLKGIGGIISKIIDWF